MIKTVSVTNYEFEEIKERNFLMEHILDNLPVATTVKDITNSYKYLIWNRKAESLYNLSRGNIVGENADVLSKEVADSFGGPIWKQPVKERLIRYSICTCLMVKSIS